MTTPVRQGLSRGGRTHPWRRHRMREGSTGLCPRWTHVLGDALITVLANLATCWSGYAKQAFCTVWIS